AEWSYVERISRMRRMADATMVTAWRYPGDVRRHSGRHLVGRAAGGAWVSGPATLRQAHEELTEGDSAGQCDVRSGNDRPAGDGTSIRSHGVGVTGTSCASSCSRRSTDS